MSKNTKTKTTKNRTQAKDLRAGKKELGSEALKKVKGGLGTYSFNVGPDIHDLAGKKK